MKLFGRKFDAQLFLSKAGDGPQSIPSAGQEFEPRRLRAARGQRNPTGDQAQQRLRPRLSSSDRREIETERPVLVPAMRGVARRVMAGRVLTPHPGLIEIAGAWASEYGLDEGTQRPGCKSPENLAPAVFLEDCVERERRCGRQIFLPWRQRSSHRFSTVARSDGLQLAEALFRNSGELLDHLGGEDAAQEHKPRLVQRRTKLVERDGGIQADTSAPLLTQGQAASRQRCPRFRSAPSRTRPTGTRDRVVGSIG